MSGYIRLAVLCAPPPAFRSGRSELDDWLAKYGLATPRSGSARVCLAEDPTGVVGYFALAAGSVDPARAGTRTRSGMPRHPIPVVLLARLAVSEQAHLRQSSPSQASGRRIGREIRSMFALRVSVAAVVVAALLCVPVGVASASTATLVRDIKPVGGSDPRALVKVGDRAYFSATDGAHGRELWVTDGTTSGTRRVKDIRPGAGGSQPETLTPVGSRVYFTANDGSHGRELWVSDGRAAGTHIVKDMTKGSRSSWTLGVIGVGDTAYFDIVYDGLYRTDGTANGTRRVHGFSGVALGHAVVKGSRLFFPAEGTRAGTSGVTAASPNWVATLWKTDGSTAGTKRLAPTDLSVAGLVKHRGRVLFKAAVHSPTGLDVPSSLWRSDGTKLGTKRSSSAYVDAASGLARMDDHLWFNGSTSLYLEDIRLYRSDGTKAGTGPVRPRIGNLRDMAPVAGRLWAHRHSPGVQDPDELWMSDGTAVGTRLVHGGDGDWFVGDWGTTEFVGLHGRVYFAAGPGGVDSDWSLVDTELWSSDGTTSGTMEAVDVNPSGSSDPRGLVRLGDSLLFTATDGQHGRELWRLDP